MFILSGFLHVYGDKQKALKVATAMKGARFKAFCNRKDAEDFAKGLYDGGVTPSKDSGDKPQATFTDMFTIYIYTINFHQNIKRKKSKKRARIYITFCLSL